MNIRGILFDLDGVIVDSSEWNKAAFNFALLDFGYDILNHKEYELTLGLGSYKQIKKLFLYRNIELQNIDAIVTNKRKYARINISKFCQPIERISEILDFVKINFCIGLVTNCSEESCLMILRKMNIESYFKVIVAGGNKPNPEPYRLGCKLIGIEPNRIFAIDDSDTGIRSATVAGCNVWKLDNFDELTLKNLIERLKLPRVGIYET